MNTPVSPTDTPPSPAPAAEPASRSVLALPFGFIVLLAAFAAVPAARENVHLLWSFLGTAVVLAIWNGALWLQATLRKRALSSHFVVRRPHWLQPLVQLSIYLYWGYYWRPVYWSGYLIASQLVFAYAFDMLLAWTLGDEYESGFGPFPIILSVNLFLWFKPDWFYWQFLMLSIGFAAKRLVRWKKDGRLTHIFNPSSLPLAVLSIILIATGTTDHTWGKEIANTLAEPPRIYQFLFLVSIPGQLLFGVTAMTMPAVIVAFAVGQIYFAVTGTYFFFGPIPTAAFLGMLLLFTDPSTAPKTELGRVIYGLLYGASIAALYGMLDLLGLPLFYDKLLFVPFLNLSVRAIDRFTERPALARFDTSRIAPNLTGRRRNLAMLGTWAVAFAIIYAFNGVRMPHPGNRFPFWREACRQNLRNGCRNMQVVEDDLCDKGSGWACNEYGIAMIQPGSGHPPGDAFKAFEDSCKLGFQLGCANRRLAEQWGPSALRHQPPEPEDYQRLIDNRGLPDSRTTLQEIQWACEQGWTEACDMLKGFQMGSAQPAENPVKLQLESACRAGDQTSCRRLGAMYGRGDGVPVDEKRALACTLGLPEGCVDPAPAAPAP